VRVLCCYTELHPDTRAALAALAPHAELVDVSGGDYAYWRAFTERWTGDDDLLNVEQDIEIHDTVIPQLEACGEPWCTFAYRLWRPDAWCYNALGCTRFSAALQREVTPGEIQQVQAQWLAPAEVPSGIAYNPAVMPLTVEAQCRCGGRGTPPCWRHMDMMIADTLEGRGPGKRDPLHAHVHTPPVVHLPVDRPVDEAAAAPREFPFTMTTRVAEYPHQEPSRTHHSASLADRPDWWPARPPGVTVTGP
jgi:hypothetical protein